MLSAESAIPLGERTVAEGHTTARLRVVSKCALRPEKVERTGEPGRSCFADSIFKPVKI